MEFELFHLVGGGCWNRRAVVGFCFWRRETSAGVFEFLVLVMLEIWISCFDVDGSGLDLWYQWDGGGLVVELFKDLDEGVTLTVNF